MLTLLDADIDHAFWEEIQSARQRALLEVANTGGVILTVRSIEIQGPRLVFVGVVPMAALEMEQRSGYGRPRIKTQGVGTFHTTWGTLLRPEDTVGFFVLCRPVTLAGEAPSIDGDHIRVAMEVRRRFTSMLGGFIGPICCIGCNEVIPEQRLKVRPEVRTCVHCQHMKETNNG